MPLGFAKATNHSESNYTCLHSIQLRFFLVLHFVFPAAGTLKKVIIILDPNRVMGSYFFPQGKKRREKQHNFLYKQTAYVWINLGNKLQGVSLTLNMRTTGHLRTLCSDAGPKKCFLGDVLLFGTQASLTDVLDGTSITDMCILLMWAFRLPSFLNTQLQSMHGNSGTPLVCKRTQTHKAPYS